MGSNDDNRLVLSVPEAAARLSISRNLCYTLVKRGIIPSLRLGARRIVIPKRGLEDFLNRKGGDNRTNLK